MDIDVVIIGLQAEKTLACCIQSVLDSSYKKGNVFIFYVDGGSCDKSVEIAKNVLGVTVLHVEKFPPTPGMGRNRGWKEGHSPFVQFLDSDTILDPKWLEKSVAFMQQHPDISALRGELRELYPKASLYNWIADQEWDVPPGICNSLGGNVLMRRAALDLVNGYNEELVVGEDPELSLRLCLKGEKLFMLNTLMAKHHIDMTRFKQYFKRAYKSGYGFANIAVLHAHETTFWWRDLGRIFVRGTAALSVLPIVLFFNQGLSFFLLTLVLYPRLFSVNFFEKEKKLSRKEAKLYAWHCSFIVIPQVLGAFRYFLGLLFKKPLSNKKSR